MKYDHKTIIKEYLLGKSTTELSKKYSINRETVRQILVKNDVPRRTRAENAKIQYDRKYFKKINSPSKAYFLGLILTDGHINNHNGYHLEIGLQSSDSHILFDFEKELKTNKTMVRPFMRGNGVRIIVSSIDIVKDLQKIGVPINKKSKIVKPIDCNKYNVDFWRGCFDGDGGIYSLQKSKTPTIGISFSGTSEMCSGFKDYFGIFNGKIHKKKTCYEFGTSISPYEKANFVYNKLYYEDCICLKRKKVIFEEFLIKRWNFENR